MGFRTSTVYALVVMFLAVPVSGQEVVFVNENGVTIRAVDADLSQLLQQLAAKTQAEVIGLDIVRGRVSMNVTDVTFAKALEESLHDFNFLVSYRRLSSGAVQTIVRIHSRRTGGDPNDRGPVRIPTLVNARLAEWQQAGSAADPNEPPDPDDPDDAGHDEEAIDNENDMIERDAAGAFAKDASAEDLAFLLDDDNPLVRLRALRELQARHPNIALARLVDALGDDDWDVSEYAIQTLGTMSSSESLKAVGESLTRSSDLQLRLRAFMVLALRAEETATVQFVKAVSRDPHELIRRSASEFLAEMSRRGRL